MIESVLLFLAVIVVLLAGYPVAFTLAGTALLFAVIGLLTGNFEIGYLSALPSRLFGIMTNETLIAVPLFIFMGITLERAKIAEDLLETLSSLFGSYRGGLGLSVILVGMLLAASTGIVGATVVTMGLLSLPTMLKRGYDPALSTGVISASGTLGQIIPPSIVLVLLGDVLSSAYQQSQLEQGIFSTQTVSVGDLFAGAVIPGVLLVGCYMLYLVALSFTKPETMPPGEKSTAQGFLLLKKVFLVLLPPLFLIVAVLGSIIAGSCNHNRSRRCWRGWCAVFGAAKKGTELGKNKRGHARDGQAYQHGFLNPDRRLRFFHWYSGAMKAMSWCSPFCCPSQAVLSVF